MSGRSASLVARLWRPSGFLCASGLPSAAALPLVCSTPSLQTSTGKPCFSQGASLAGAAELPRVPWGSLLPFSAFSTEADAGPSASSSKEIPSWAYRRRFRNRRSALAETTGPYAPPTCEKPAKRINQWRRMEQKKQSIKAAAQERRRNEMQRKMERDAKRAERWRKVAALWKGTRAEKAAPQPADGG